MGKSVLAIIGGNIREGGKEAEVLVSFLHVAVVPSRLRRTERSGADGVGAEEEFETLSFVEAQLGKVRPIWGCQMKLIFSARARKKPGQDPDPEKREQTENISPVT